MLQELCELFIVKLFAVFETQTIYESIEVYIFRVDLKSKLSHDSLELILKVVILLCVVIKIAFEDGVQEHLVP